MKKLSIYIIKELSLPFAIGFIFFTFIFMLQQVFIIFDYIINKNVEVRLVLKLFAIMLPNTMPRTIPVALLFAVITALGRLSNDSEIIALKSAGVSILRVIKPVIASGVVVFVIMILFYETILVYCNKNYNRILIDIMKSSPTAMLEEGVFTELGDKWIRVEKIRKDTGRLENIMIFVKNSNNNWDVFKAEHGQLMQNEDGSKSLKLYSGKIFSGRQESNIFSIHDFSKGDAEILLSESKLEISAKDKKNPMEMNTMELYRTLRADKKSHREDRETASFWVELYNKSATPFSCVVFALIGAPLGISVRRNTKGISFGISIIVIFLYFILSMAGQSLSIRGIINPLIGVWYANILLLLSGIILIFLKEKI